MEPTIVFVRHAHRDTSLRSMDNGLDEKGQNQVKELLKNLSSGRLPQSLDFRTSPKLRCKETLSPLADFCKSPLEVIDDLDEQKPEETTKEFQGRVFKYLEHLQKMKGTVYICSHGDWLPEALQELTGKWVDIKKGRYAICVKRNSKWEIL